MVKWIVIAALCILIFVLLLRAALFRPQKETFEPMEKPQLDEKEETERLARLIRCKTVSSRDPALVDEAEFEKFRALLIELFPKVHATCTRELINGGLLYHWAGKTAQEPGILMAHYDVVPVDEAGWNVDPFAGIVKDGSLWGRGTLDTKCSLFGILEAAEKLIGEGFVPEHDLYFSFGCDEEVEGKAARAIVETLKARQIHPAFVLDEGGTIVTNFLPGVKMPLAVIGVGEKGQVDLELTLRGKSGHAAYPPRHTLIGRMSRIVRRVENRQFKMKMTPPVRQLIDVLGRTLPFPIRIILANTGFFMPLIKLVCRFVPIGGALMRTTIAFTQTQGSLASNVLPDRVTAVANFRLAEGETVEGVVAHVKKAARCSDLETRVLKGNLATPNSPAEGPHWQRIKNAIHATWPDTLVAPYLMFMCSDSSQFCAICDHVYRFSPMVCTNEQVASIHSNNEHITTKNITQIIEFYEYLIRQS